MKDIDVEWTNARMSIERSSKQLRQWIRRERENPRTGPAPTWNLPRILAVAIIRQLQADRKRGEHHAAEILEAIQEWRRRLDRQRRAAARTAANRGT